MKEQKQKTSLYESIRKKATVLAKAVTFNHVAEIIAAIFVFRSVLNLLNKGELGPFSLNSILELMFTVLLLFWLFRLAFRLLVSLLVPPDTPIWGEPTRLSFEEFSELLDLLKQMNLEQSNQFLTIVRKQLEKMAQPSSKENSSDK